MSSVSYSLGIPTDYYPVTPNDSTDNVKANSSDELIGFYIQGAGDIVVTTKSGDRTISVPDNYTLIVGNAARVKSTGTTATGIFSLIV